VRSKPLFFGGGGVTFTGGEATLQAEALLRCLPRLQAHGIHTALETNAVSAALLSLSPYIDYLIMDFKHHDGDALRRYTGADITAVRRHFEWLCANRGQLHVRIPLIHGINDAEPAAFAGYFAQHAQEGTVFELLPYHEYGKDKWTSPYQVEDGFVPPETVAYFEQIFMQHGLHMIHT
jgi:pyruvate formate lyase activating enzyme